MATLFILSLFLAYITLGLPDSGWGVIWPYMRVELAVPLEMAGYFTMITTVCSAISSLVMPIIIKKFGTRTLPAICSLATGLSILGIALAQNFAVVLVLAIPLGLFAGGIDVAINNYVSERYSSRVMNWLHASWGLGAMLSPILITLALNSNGSWRLGYGIIAGCQLFAALILFCALPLWKKAERPLKLLSNAQLSTSSNKVKIPAMALSTLVFFVYAFIEVGVGVWLNSLLVEFRHYDVTLSGTAVSVFYGSIMAGRFIFGTFSNKIGNRWAIRLGIALALVGAGLFTVRDNSTCTLVALTLIGLGYAPIYPSSMHETNRRFSRDTARTLMGLQMTGACVGFFVSSPIIGNLGAHISLEVMPWLVLAGLIILLFATQTLDLLTKARKSLFVDFHTDHGVYAPIDAVDGAMLSIAESANEIKTDK